MTYKEFEVFYQQEDPEDLLDPSLRRLPPAHVSTIPEEANTLEGMMLKEKTPELLALLTAHAGGATPVVLGVF